MWRSRLPTYPIQIPHRAFEVSKVSFALEFGACDHFLIGQMGFEIELSEECEEVRWRPKTALGMRDGPPIITHYFIRAGRQGGTGGTLGMRLH